MQAGCAYSPTDLAQYFDEPTTVVRDMLCTLAEEGRVGMTSQSSRIIRFQRSQAHTAARLTGRPQPRGVCQIRRITNHMMQRTRLATACLSAALTAVTPLAFGQSFTDRLVDQVRGLVSPASQPDTLTTPAGQTIEVGFSPEGGAEALVLGCPQDSDFYVRD